MFNRRNVVYGLSGVAGLGIFGFGPVKGAPVIVESPKFNPDKTIRRWAGNSIICPVGLDTPLHLALASYHKRIAALKAAESMVLLPPSSYHMTVFDGAADENRIPGFWPGDLPLDTPLEECHRHLYKKLLSFGLGCATPFRMKVDLSSAGNPRPGIGLVPIDAQENLKLRSLRDRLSEVLQIRSPDHDSYRFHISISYIVQPFSPEAKLEYASDYRQGLEQLAKQFPVIEMTHPSFCFFEDMFAFVPQIDLSLKSKGAG